MMSKEEYLSGYRENKKNKIRNKNTNEQLSNQDKMRENVKTV